MGVAEELPQEGWFGRRGRELPRPEARERHPRIDHRSRLAVVQEELWQGVASGVSGPCAGGEPQWPDRGAMATQADGYAEREAALLMLEEKQKGNKGRITVGADKTYDSKDFITAARALNVTAHVTKNENGRGSNLDRRTTRHPGYAISLSRRWLVEKSFGWLKQTGPIRQVKLRGLHKVDWIFVFSCAAHNLMRLPRLFAQLAEQDLPQNCA